MLWRNANPRQCVPLKWAGEEILELKLSSSQMKNKNGRENIHPQSIYRTMILYMVLKIYRREAALVVLASKFLERPSHNS